MFANVVLADEINRASPKTQSALLESMEERQVSVDAQTYKLPRPFMVIATQNPVELEGTYPLPEAQLDRFLLRLRIGYPDRDAEIAILDAEGGDPIDPDELEPVTDRRDRRPRGSTSSAASTSRPSCRATSSTSPRRPATTATSCSASARAARSRCSARRARLAASIGRSYVVPDDVKVLASAVLEHRLLLSSEAMMRGVNPADVLAAILDTRARTRDPRRLTPGTGVVAMLTRRGWSFVGAAVGLYRRRPAARPGAARGARGRRPCCC